jgi:insecticidal toxin complex protein TccC
MPKNASADVKEEVAAEFVWRGHMSAIEEASKKGKFAVSFRASGKYTINALERGAAAKGHDILEKTIKPASIGKFYGENAEAKWKMVEQAGLSGYVGHWRDNELAGVYMHSRHPLGEAVHNSIYPIDMRSQATLDQSLTTLHSAENWTAQPYTGDYDTHDMITFRGAGRPRTVLVNSLEEKLIIDAINREVAKVDTNRPFDAIEHNVVRHGPQVNFSSYMMAHEADEVSAHNGFLGAVARPGEFPLAMCDRGTWNIINNLAELELFYQSVGARIKETWAEDGERTYQDTSKSMVKLGRRRLTQAR